MKKAIVTGANGFVGTALVKELSARKIEVIAVVRDAKENVSEIAGLPGLRIVYCDLAELSELNDKIIDRDADVFYHLAWVGSAGPLRGNYEVQLHNAKYTCDAVKACAAIECPKFVFASSIMEYECAKLMEAGKKPSINTQYSTAKIAANYMAKAQAAALDIEYVSAVISNIYGEGERSPRLINTSLRKLLAGEHVSFSSGEQMYDFVYITDAAKAFAAIGEKGVPFQTYYIGSLNPHPLKEFLQELRDGVDPSIEIGLGEIPFDGVTLTYEEFDVFALKHDTGFEPQISFAEGVQKTIAWLEEEGKQ